MRLLLRRGEIDLVRADQDARGHAGRVVAALAEHMPGQIIPQFAEPDGNFPNGVPNPLLEENRAVTAEAVKTHGADLGIAFDGDADRLGVVSPSGDIIFPDRVMMLLAMDVLDRVPGATILYDVKCTWHLPKAHYLESWGDAQPLVVGNRVIVWTEGDGSKTCGQEGITTVLARAFDAGDVPRGDAVEVVGEDAPALLDCPSVFAKKELFAILGWSRAALGYGLIPVACDQGGKMLMGMIRSAKGMIADGRPLVIFPEGTRKPVGRPGPVKRGLGILVESAGAPWMPCFVRGTSSVRTARNPETPMELWLGPPSYPHGVEALRATGLDAGVIQTRVGELYLAQIRALSQRAQEYRPLPDYEV